MIEVRNLTNVVRIVSTTFHEQLFAAVERLLVQHSYRYKPVPHDEYELRLKLEALLRQHLHEYKCYVRFVDNY